MKTTKTYLVEYSEMEGDNYAGGWVTKACHSNDITRFKHLVSVTPVEIKMGKPLNDTEKCRLLKRQKKEKEMANVKSKVESLKKKMAEDADKLKELESML